MTLESRLIALAQAMGSGRVAGGRAGSPEGVDGLFGLVGVGEEVQAPTGDRQAGSRSPARMRERSWSTAFVWIWHTRLSVTPST